MVKFRHSMTGRGPKEHVDGHRFRFQTPHRHRLRNARAGRRRLLRRARLRRTEHRHRLLSPRGRLERRRRRRYRSGRSRLCRGERHGGGRRAGPARRHYGLRQLRGAAPRPAATADRQRPDGRQAAQPLRPSRHGGGAGRGQRRRDGCAPRHDRQERLWRRRPPAFRDDPGRRAADQRRRLQPVGRARRLDRSGGLHRCEQGDGRRRCAGDQRFGRSGVRERQRQRDAGGVRGVAVGAFRADGDGGGQAAGRDGGARQRGAVALLHGECLRSLQRNGAGQLCAGRDQQDPARLGPWRRRRRGGRERGAGTGRAGERQPRGQCAHAARHRLGAGRRRHRREAGAVRVEPHACRGRRRCGRGAVHRQPLAALGQCAGLRLHHAGHFGDGGQRLHRALGHAELRGGPDRGGRARAGER